MAALTTLLHMAGALTYAVVTAVPPPTAVPIPACGTSTPDSLEVHWTADAAFSHYYVQLSQSDSAQSLAQPFALHVSTGASLNFTGLAPGTAYTVSLRALSIKAPSMSWGPAWQPLGHGIACRTSHGRASAEGAAPLIPQSVDTQFMRVYRISEYSFDVDFLPNHDTASIDAMPLYLMTCSPGGNCSPFDAKEVSPKWDSCHAAMERVCPSRRGAAFNCMACADANRDVLTAACGDFSDEDTMEGAGSFAVHWWCGVGWPESAAVQGPITEYCVEYAPMKEETRMGDGFSEYLSCNSDEVDGTLGNDPRDPACICVVMDDRLLAHESNDSTLLADCYEGGMAWIHETRCNCTGQVPKSSIPSSENPSLMHVGRMPVWLPYVGIELKPWVPGKFQEASGYNYHFPKDGACGIDEAIGTNGCTWRMAPQTRMIYGNDILAQGWNRTFVADTDSDLSHTKQNVNTFKVALKSLENLVKPMPCGPEKSVISI